MPDPLDKETRSKIMKSIRSKDTRPERILRSVLHRSGFRFRLHVQGMPGTPDIVLPKYRAVIFVHGCFWHQHRSPVCRDSHAPRSNLEYWQSKLAKNVKRDAEHLARLKAEGWRVFVVWECEMKNIPRLTSRLQRFLG